MKIFIALIFLLFFTGCSTKEIKVAQQESPPPKKHSALSITAPTIESKKIWLDTFIETVQAIRTVTKNLHLHNKTVYREQLTRENDLIFNQLLFDTADFNEAIEEQTPELRDRIIKSLLLVIQSQLETDRLTTGVESKLNGKARKNIELLAGLGANRNDLAINDLGLECGELNQCIMAFKRTTAQRK